MIAVLHKVNVIPRRVDVLQEFIETSLTGVFGSELLTSRSGAVGVEEQASTIN